MANTHDPLQCPRPLTEGEKITFGNIPALNPAQCTALHPPSKKYNCVAWSLGYQDRWIDPGTKTQMENMC